MTTMPESEFLRWAAGKGLALDPKYPQAAELAFLGPSESRFWDVPPAPERRPHFLKSLVDLMGDWRTCHVWRHLGRWPVPKHVSPRRINDSVELTILRGLGLPLGTEEVVSFAHDERDALVTLLFSTTVFGWSAGQDLYLVPDHARQVLQTDHHDAAHVLFSNPGDLDRWVTGMSAAGFDLPADLPDATFKRPAWMAGRDGVGSGSSIS